MDLNIQNVVKRYDNITALDNVSLDIPHGSLVCFLGPSGCGKTTLLRAVAGLEDINSGMIRLGDADLSHTLARSRNFGVVFQSYSLFPHMSAARNIAYGLECRRWSKPQIKARVAEMLDLVHLADQADKFPSQMSGGQQQRIAIARALAPNPSLLLLDEPLSALDAKVREELRLEIRSLQQRLGITTIMVTHDQEEALAMADVIVVMKGGHIEQIGTPEDLYLAPETSFVADFIGRMNILPVTAGADQNHVTFAGSSLKVLQVPVTMKDNIRKLGIRPENINLCNADHASQPNHIAATMRNITYLGNISRLELQADAAPSISISVEIHGITRIQMSSLPRIGDPMALHLPEGALRVLT